MSEDLTRRVRSFTIGTTISRILGLARESVFMYLFGAGFASDAFNVAFRIPNILRDLLAETSLSAAFIPTFSETLAKKGEAEAFRLASNVLNAILLVGGIVSVLGMVFSHSIVSVLALGFEKVPDKLAITSLLTRIIFPFLLFVTLAAWAMGILNTFNKFFVPAVAPAFWNIISILTPVVLFGFLVHRGINPIVGMAIGVTLGGLVQFLIQVPSLFKQGFKYSKYLNFRDEGFKKIFRLYVPTSLGLAASKINFAINTFLISFLPQQGSITWLNCGYRIMHLPLGLFGIAVGSVALPALARRVSEGKIDTVKSTLIESMKLVLLLTIPITVLFAFFATPISRLIFEHGLFTGLDTSFTAQALVLYTLGIPFASCVRVVASLFYSFHDARRPMYAGIVSVGVNLILNLLLMNLLRFRAFPLATSIASLANLLILFYYLKQHLPGLSLSPFLKDFGIITLVSLPAGLAGLWFEKFLENCLGLGFFPQVFQVIAGLFVAVLVFYSVSQLVGLKEVKILVKKLLS